MSNLDLDTFVKVQTLIYQNQQLSDFDWIQMVNKILRDRSENYKIIGIIGSSGDHNLHEHK